MQNFSLLKEVGQSSRPVLLKRGMHSTLEEWLNCAEYILSEGNPNVILCERGIRTFEKYTRNTLDLSAVPAIKELTHLPIIIDPTHSTGRVSLIGPMSMAAVAAGAARSRPAPVANKVVPPANISPTPTPSMSNSSRPVSDRPSTKLPVP